MNNVLETRRTILRRWLAATAAGLGASALPARAQKLAPTLECDADAEPTISETAGPFFTPNSPLKKDFRQDAPGDAVTLYGRVLRRDCAAVKGALVDLWHADAAGRYDNDGYVLRGHQVTDEDGRYVFETIIPGLYPGRTRHYHIKAQPPGGRSLTTQLYFPDEAQNASDGLFDARLLMRLDAAADGKVGRFDVVLR